MKILKISLLSFILVSLVVMASSFSAKRLAAQSYQYNTTFQMGDPATPLDNAGNWDAVSSLAGCVNSSFLCGIDVVNIPGETVLPSEQAIIDQIKAAYVPSTPFTHGQVVDIKNALNVKVAEATVYRIN